MPDATGIRSLDDVARKLVDVAEREDAKRRRRPAWLRDVPRFAVAAVLACAVIVGLLLLVTSVGTDQRARPAPQADDVLSPGELWYMRVKNTNFVGAKPSTTTVETWAGADGSGRVTFDGRDAPPEPDGVSLSIGPRTDLTYDEVLALPSAPGPLRDRLARLLARDRVGAWLQNGALSLFTGPFPVRRATREALVEVLRGLPGVEIDETSPDRVVVATKNRYGTVRTTLDHRTFSIVRSSSYVRGKEVQRTVFEHTGIVRSTRERPGSDPSINGVFVDNLAVFRRPQRESDIPRRSERRLGVDPKVLDFANARRVGTSGDGEPVYIVPGRALVCMTNGGCVDAERIARGESAAEWEDCDPVEVHAIVPDSARNVHINRHDGTRVDVTVRDSAVIKRVDSIGGPNENGALVWDGPNGRFAVAIHGCPG